MSPIKLQLVNRSIEDPNGHQHNINVYTHNEDSSYEHRHNVLDAYVFLVRLVQKGLNNIIIFTNADINLTI